MPDLRDVADLLAGALDQLDGLREMVGCRIEGETLLFDLYASGRRSDLTRAVTRAVDEALRPLGRRATVRFRGGEPWIAGGTIRVEMTCEVRLEVPLLRGE